MRIRIGPFASMLRSPRVWEIACRSPWLFAGEDLHHAGLHALAAADYGPAAELFECAAERYRHDLRTEALARVRVHQLMARACAAGGRMSPLSLEADRALARLDRIESPVFPFPLMPAHVLLASWLEDAEAAADLRLAA